VGNEEKGRKKEERAEKIGGAALGVAVRAVARHRRATAACSGRRHRRRAPRSRTTTTYNPLLELAGQLRQGEKQELLTYTTDEGADYLRLTTLDRFDPDRGWSSSALSADIDEDRVDDVPPPVGRSAPTDEVDVTIELTRRLGGPWLPVPAVPDAIDIDGPWLWDPEAETVFSTRTSARDVEDPYTVTTSRVQPDVALLRRSQSPPERIAETYAADPELSPYARSVLEKVTAGATTDFDRVAALQTFFRDTDFRYDESTATPDTDQPDALTDFLRARRGFCEQFAAAMAALVRGAEIPARVAVGFISGPRDDEGRYTVSTREAHAWPEVWFEGAGWVRFEPTPRNDGRRRRARLQRRAAGVGRRRPPTAAPRPLRPPQPQTGRRRPRAGRPRRRGRARRAATASSEGRRPGGCWCRRRWRLLAVPALLAVRRRRRVGAPGRARGLGVVTDDAVDVGTAGGRPTHRARRRPLPVRHLPDDAAEALQRLAAGAERARYARHRALCRRLVAAGRRVHRPGRPAGRRDPARALDGEVAARLDGAVDELAARHRRRRRARPLRRHRLDPRRQGAPPADAGGPRRLSPPPSVGRGWAARGRCAGVAVRVP
jgi:transglutaminase-like putative cysteine protease